MRKASSSFISNTKLETMLTELGPTVADDSTLPLFAVPADLRRWGARVRLADRSAARASWMLCETALLYVGVVFLGETIDRWWGWAIAWVGLVVCMMRIDAAHHEAIHRSLYVRRWPNDLVAVIAGALEGLHGPAYRSYHLTHHALTRRDVEPTDPESFYDELLTRPLAIGPLRIRARVVYVVGILIGGVSFALQMLIGAVGTLLGRPPSYVRAASLERHVRRWGWLPFGLWLGGTAAALLTGHGAQLVHWWLVPLLLFLCGPYMFFALPEHYAAPHDGAMIASTGSVRSTPFYRWLTLDGNYHLAHHVFPTASWWRLADADGQLRNVSTLSYRGYIAFHRLAWKNMAGPDEPAS